MPRRARQTLEGDFEHQAFVGLVGDFPHRAETVDGVSPDEAVDFQQFLVGEAEIGLADGHKLVAVVALLPDAECVVGIVGRALAVPALRIHQNGIHRERIALPFPPRPARAAGHVGRIAPLEHDAFDGIGVAAGGGRIGTRGFQFVPGLECDHGREIDARIGELGHERFQAFAPRGKRKIAQVLHAIGEKIVGAQMRREFGKQLRRDGFAV